MAVCIKLISLKKWDIVIKVDTDIRYLDVSVYDQRQTSFHYA